MFKNPDSAKQYETLTAELKSLVDEALEQRQYRKAYNQRADVQDKRKAYNKKRNKLIRELLAAHNADTDTEDGDDIS